MRTNFLLIDSDSDAAGAAQIVTVYGKSNVCLCITIDKGVDRLWVQDDDLEKFAVNILKALKSKKL